VSGGILLVAECRSGHVARASLEGLGAAGTLRAMFAGSVSAVVVGAGMSSVPSMLAAHGADEVYVFEDAALDHSTTEVHVRAVTAVVAECQPACVFLPDSAYGRDVASRLSGHLGAGLATGCVRFEAAPDGELFAERPVFGGRFTERVSWAAAPRLATLKSGVFPVPSADSSRQAPLLRREVTPNARASVVGTERAETAGANRPDIEDARTVVSAGRGLGTSEQLRLVEDLADALGGAVGASRAVVDLGWLDHQHQVGQTGRAVAPELYIACGISGAMQHLAGIASARTIVAINRDAEAPIFGVADYGVVGDLAQVLPRLVAALRAMAAEQAGAGA
jgi:electron transfer flavoprotein alpha subunit